MSYERSSGVSGGFGYRGTPKADKKAEAPTEAPAEEEEGEGEGEGDDDAFDPADHTVDEVLDYVDSNPDEADIIRESEEAGKGRIGILDHI